MVENGKKYEKMVKTQNRPFFPRSEAAKRSQGPEWSRKVPKSQKVPKVKKVKKKSDFDQNWTFSSRFEATRHYFTND